MIADSAQTSISSRSSKRARQRTRGQSLIEFALVLPIMLLMLVIAVDFGRAYTAYMTVSSAAREGATYASRSADNATNTAEIQNRVREEIGSGGQIWGNTASASVSSGTDSQGYGRVSVTVDYTFEPWMSVWPIPGSVDINRTVTMRVLGN